MSPHRIILFQAEIKGNLVLICAVIACSINRNRRVVHSALLSRLGEKMHFLFKKKDGRRALSVQAAALYNINFSAQGN